MYPRDIAGKDARDVHLAVERRRAAEVERKKRIFDHKSRTIGLDLCALRQQQEEKRAHHQLEKQRADAYDLLCTSLDELAMREMKEEEELKRRLAKDLTQFRAEQQRAESIRDAGLNLGQKGAANTLPEELLGPASMQVFQGEGLNEKEIKRAQMDKTLEFLKDQKLQKQKQLREQLNKELQFDKMMVDNDLLTIHHEIVEEESRKAGRMALRKYHEDQAKERMERERQEKLRIEQEDQAEIEYMVTSDLLTENLDAAIKGSQVLTDRWKGMSPDQKKAILQKREDQRCERKKWIESEKQQDLAWQQQMVDQARQQLREEEREEMLKRDLRVNLDQFNQRLGRKQHANQVYLDKEVYVNDPTGQYFDQFNTTSR